MMTERNTKSAEGSALEYTKSKSVLLSASPFGGVASRTKRALEEKIFLFIVGEEPKREQGRQC
jgi:hypothetical protein